MENCPGKVTCAGQCCVSVCRDDQPQKPRSWGLVFVLFGAYVALAGRGPHLTFGLSEESLKGPLRRR